MDKGKSSTIDNIKAAHYVQGFNKIMNAAVKAIHQEIRNSKGVMVNGVPDSIRDACKEQIAAEMTNILRTDPTLSNLFRGVTIGYRKGEDGNKSFGVETQALPPVSWTSINAPKPTQPEQTLAQEETRLAGLKKIVMASLTDLDKATDQELRDAYDDISNNPASYHATTRKHRVSSRGLAVTAIAYIVAIGAIAGMVPLWMQYTDLEAQWDVVVGQVPGLRGNFDDFVHLSAGADPVFTAKFYALDANSQGLIHQAIDLGNQMHGPMFTAAIVTAFAVSILMWGWIVPVLTGGVAEEKVQQQMAEKLGMSETAVQDAVNKAVEAVGTAMEQGKSIKVPDTQGQDKEAATAVTKMCNRLVQFSAALHQAAEQQQAKGQGTERN